MQETPTISVASKPCFGKAWMVCMVAALYFFYIFIQMTKFNAIGQELMADFKIGSTGLGTLSSIYFWGNVIFLFPAGLLLDRFSSKKILMIVMLIAIVCTLLFAYTNSVPTASWCFLFLGVAGAFALILPLRIVSRWFPPEKMALVSGLTITVGFFGAMVSQSPLTWLVTLVGWRHAMIWDAIFGVVLLVIMMAVISDYPPGAVKEMTKEQATSLKVLWEDIKKSIANRQNWLFGIYTCLVNLPIFVFGAVFGTRFLEQIHHVTTAQAAFAMMLMFLGAMAGSPAFGWFSDKLQLRKLPMFFGGIVSLALVLLVMYVIPMPHILLCVIFFGIGFFTSSQVITYPVIAESNSPDVIATSMSIGSTLIMSGGAIFVPLFGWLLDIYWHGEMVNNIPVHSLTEYRFALWMLPMAFIVGMLAIIFGKETRCKRLQ
jgi:MFS family permease